jgi:glycosyltransferase involved in cell wall biosynthesis
MIDKSASLRILHVIDSLAAGGTERVLATVVRGLHAQGLAQAVHRLTGDGQLQGLIPTDCPQMSGSSMDSIVSSIQTFRPHAIQTWSDNAAIATASLAVAQAIPMLHRIATMLSAQYTARGDLQVRRLKAALQNTTCIQALSKTAADDAAAFLDIPRPVVIQNGFPLAYAPGVPAPIKTPDTFLIVSVGRLVAEKGHQHLLAALPAIVTKYPAVRCWIVGDGPLEGQLREQIDALGLQHAVTLQGYQENVPDILARADLFVMPSLHEGFGNALLEAMAAGLPVIASDLPAIRQDIVDNSQACRLIRAGDPAALQRAIDFFLHQENVRRVYGQRAQLVAARFQASRMIEDYVETYTRLLSWRTTA